MSTINSLWNSFVKTNFYADLGIEVPSNLEGLAFHDLCDHGVSPYKEGDYIPTSVWGECLAQINGQTRAYVRAHLKYGQKIWDFEWFEQNYLLEFMSGISEIGADGLPNGEYIDYSSEYAQYDKEYLKTFYQECIDFWWNHPLLEELFMLAQN